MTILLVMGVKNELHALVDAGIITKVEVEDEDDAFETLLQLLSDADVFRKALVVCPRAAGSEYSSWKCVCVGHAIGARA
jgi:hypothetical protein